MGSDEKFEFEAMTNQEAARIFRELADRIEGISSGSESLLSPEMAEFRKLKIGLKLEADGYSIKIKVKSDRPPEFETAEFETADSDDPRKTRFPKYKEVKKRMKGNFKMIADSLEANTLPPETTVTAFLADSKLMIKFPKYGAEFFSDYDGACARFREAFESHDLETCKTAVQELDRLKAECHEKFK